VAPREVAQVLRRGGSAGHLCIVSIRHSWGLVMLTDLSTDEQLHDWLASL
jgi:hypothetical protein